MIFRHKLGLRIAVALAATTLGCAEASGPSGGLASGGTSAGGAAGTGGVVVDAGSGGTLAVDAGSGGSFAGVPETCAESELAKSYIGCEYWPTITPNSQLSDVFEFAIAAANPTKTPAVVTVEKAGVVVATMTVTPGDIATTTLPWDEELKQTRPFAYATTMKSAVVPGGAFHVTSTVPIVLYQFNPLEFQKPIPPEVGCQIDLDVNACVSFSNDASLLLPTTALRNDYFVVTRPSFHLGNEFATNTTWVEMPSFVAVTATKDDTGVTIHATSSVRAGSGGILEAPPGGTHQFSLNAGDVVVLIPSLLPDQETTAPDAPCATMDVFQSKYHLCTSSAAHDFTGTRVTSDKPVSVLGGHDCAMVPHGLWACDHLEESMIPVESLGTELVVTAPQSTVDLVTQGVNAPMYVRVLSAGAKNDIEFDPPSVHAPVTLGEGQFIEIGPISEDFVVRGTNRLLVAQFMTGKNDTGVLVKGEVGDPSVSLAIPSEQFRTSYTVLAPLTYKHDFVNVIAKKGTSVSVDGVAIDASEFVSIGDGTYQVARHAVSGGAHSLTGSDTFGVVVYGYGLYTSYMYPGGLNLETVVVTPK